MEALCNINVFQEDCLMSRYKHPFDLAKELSVHGTRTGVRPLISERTQRKYRWLASIPQEIQSVIRQYEDIFTTRILLNIFASRQAHFEKENWKYLRAEVARYLQKGKPHRPRKALNYPKGRAGGSIEQQRKRQTEFKEEPKHAPAHKLQSEVMAELSAQNTLREKLSTWVEVSNGEIRIKYCGEEDLERLLEIIQASSTGSTNRPNFPSHSTHRQASFCLDR
jgi:hypothetical protein